MGLLTELYIELLAMLMRTESEPQPEINNVIYVDFKAKKRKAA